MGWFNRLSNLIRRRDLNPEIDEELQFHLEASIRDNVSAGMSDDEARRDAYRRFGSRAGLRERTRDANVLAGIEHLWQDLKYGARVFARHPALTSICIISIAFGTGANVAMFGVADLLLLRPLPISRPDEVVSVGTKVPFGERDWTLASYPDYLDLRDRARSFSGLAASDNEFVAIGTRPGETSHVRLASFVSDNFFSVLGVEPSLGRGFSPAEADAANPSAVAVLANALWRSDFGADPAVLGRTLRISGIDFTIVGVAPESFTGLHPFIREALYLPLGMMPHLTDGQRPDVLRARDVRIIRLKGRLRAGETVERARVELTAIGLDLEREHPDTNAGQALIAQTEFESKFADRPLDAALVVILTTLSLAVLCVACANVAGLLASRGPARAREMALRLAIGAGRERLVRQLITESLGIAIAGAAAGLVVAKIGNALLRQIRFPTEMFAPPPFVLDQRMLLFSLVVAVASALLVGIGPALTTTRVDLTSALKANSEGRAARRRLTGRSVLVTVQVALSLVLLTLAIFSVQIFHTELATGPGFRTTHIAKVTIAPGQARYTEPEAGRFFAQVLDQARALPGVQSASLTSAMPMFSFEFVSIVPDGQPWVGLQATNPLTRSNSVDDQFFDTMEIALLRGRRFTSADTAGAPPVAIVNDTLAHHYWPDDDPIGKGLRLLEPNGPVVRVVGVVSTTKFWVPGELPLDGIYFPYLQRPRGHMVLLAATAGDSTPILEPLRNLAQSQDPDVPVFDVQTMETFYDAVARSLLNVLVRLVGGMGLMGMALTMVGLYGLVSYDVNRRTREIGIRVAIGATYSRILTMVLRQGMAPAWAGLAIGLVLSAVTARVLTGVVPYSHHVDSLTYYLVVPLVVTITLLAAFIPARRAARVNPTVALICE